ncbi:MAG: nucleotidyltransferase domain-containing protein [Acetobacteraceae bacterium]|nr:nucleotidyltransferase domain-containing protein [Acetobacteraceae bacterium]
MVRAGETFGWGNQRRVAEAVPLLTPVLFKARARRILGRAGQRALLLLRRSLPPYISLSVFGSYVAGNYTSRPDRSSDVDLLVVLEDEVSPQDSERVQAGVEAVRARTGVSFHLFLVPARTLWQKVCRGDFQVLNLLMIAAAVEDVGFSNALRGLIFSGAQGYGPEEARHLVELARRSLERAGEHLNGGRRGKPLASALHLAACSAVQAYLLAAVPQGAPGTLRLVPKDLPGLFREWARPPVTAGQVEGFCRLCEFFRSFKAKKGALMEAALVQAQWELCRGLLEVAEAALRARGGQGQDEAGAGEF